MYRFLVTPKWIFAHILVVVAVGFFIWAGFWQLSRLEQARDARALGEGRVSATAVPLDELIADTGGAVDDLLYRRVQVSGTYLADLQVATPPRSRDGRPGNLLLTPLQPAGGGQAVLVERGWVPFTRNGLLSERAQPPEDEVTVEGVLLPVENPGANDVFNDAGLVRFINPPAMQQDLGVALQPLALRLLEQAPAPAGELPVAGRVPTFDEGNHLSYAVQWFLFATTVVVGYPILLRRTAEESVRKPQLVGHSET